MPIKPLSQHNIEIARNAKAWNNKPLLRLVYHNIYSTIAKALETTNGEGTLEIGSGIGAIKTVLPKCITSDIFENPWLDRIENAYNLHFSENCLDGVVLFDVWHHLQYPGLALKEFARVLRPGGRLVLFEPAMGLLGQMIYGCIHHEPLGFNQVIQWYPPNNTPPTLSYYAAQANCWRIFCTKTDQIDLKLPFKQTKLQLFSAITYIATGGFSKPQLYPTCLHPLIAKFETICDKKPNLFATRMLVVLTKSPPK